MAIKSSPFILARIVAFLIVGLMLGFPSHSLAQVLDVSADGMSCTDTGRDYTSLRNQLPEFLTDKAVGPPGFNLYKGTGQDADKLAYYYRNRDNSICLVDIKANSAFAISTPTEIQKAQVLSLMAEEIEAMVKQCEKNAQPRWRYLTKLNTIVFDVLQGIYLETGKFVGCRKTVLAELAAVGISTKSSAGLLVLFNGNVFLIRL